MIEQLRCPAPHIDLEVSCTDLSDTVPLALTDLIEADRVEQQAEVERSDGRASHKRKDEDVCSTSTHAPGIQAVRERDCTLLSTQAHTRSKERSSPP